MKLQKFSVCSEVKLFEVFLNRNLNIVYVVEMNLIIVSHRFLPKKGDDKDYREPDLVVDESHVIGIREASHQQPIITGGDSMISQQEPDVVETTDKHSSASSNSLEGRESFPSEPANSLVTATNTYTPSSSFTTEGMHDESSQLVIATGTSSDNDVTNNDITSYGVSVSEEDTT